MLIGIDFDNTIISYDELFHRVAGEQGLLAADVPASKGHVRDYLRQAGREDAWTEMQGLVYGGRIKEARAFPGFREFLLACQGRGVEVAVVSHKTRTPFLGPPFDLHRAAHDWLEGQQVYNGGPAGLTRARVFFELTKQAKLERIAALGCTYFVDDLPEFLAEPGFPTGVERILFDPNGTGEGAPFRRATSWQAVSNLVLGPAPAGEEPWRPAAARLVARAELGALRHLQPLAGGANNRVFRVEAEHGAAVLKVYFQHAQDPRDRLGAEFAFCRFAWDHGVRALPRPLAYDREHGIGLYEYVPGRPLRTDEVGTEAVNDALDFYSKLNRHKHLPEACELARASESCFTLAEHLATVEGRVRRLQSCDGTTVIDLEARAFVHDQLLPAWQRVAESVPQRAAELGLALDATLPETDRCLSPSDFGFHNALLAEDGRLRFLDFEYAGWDDPAKLICDFFCQPALPVSTCYYEHFVRGICGGLAEPELHRRRTDLLLPVYRVKWCCIVLNDFLPVSSTRRRFGAAAGVDPEQRKAVQLNKARQELARTMD